MTPMTTKRTALNIRAATVRDVEAMRLIYNYWVDKSTATFDTAPQAHTQRLDWFAEHQAENLPVVVAEDEGVVVGWGSLSYYHPRCAYRTTMEPSIYVHHEHTGKGVGRALLSHLISQAKNNGYHCLVGLICSENEKSLQLCRSFGFEHIGELKEVGRKFDRWLNVILVQKMLKRDE